MFVKDEFPNRIRDLPPAMLFFGGIGFALVTVALIAALLS